MESTSKEWIIGKNIVHEIGHGISFKEIPKNFFGIAECEAKAKWAAETERFKSTKTAMICTGMMMVVVVSVMMSSSRAPSIVEQSFFAVLIVDFPLLFVAQHLVSFAKFAESDSCLLLVVRIFVGMPAQGKLSVSAKKKKEHIMPFCSVAKRSFHTNRTVKRWGTLHRSSHTESGSASTIKSGYF